MSRTSSVIALSLIAVLIVEAAAALLFRLRKHSLEHAGLTRKYLVCTPRGSELLAGKRPLVLAIYGGGHTWPSGGQYLPKKFVGPVTYDIDGATEIWGFFKTFE